MVESAVVTAAEIARIAGVTRATVSNWRRRYRDFPAPCGGTDASPAYDRTKVEDWLAARGTLPEISPEERLWRAVTAEAGGGGGLGGAVTRAAEALANPAGPAAPDRATPGAEMTAALIAALAALGPAEILDALLDRYAEAAGVDLTPRPVAELMASLAGQDLGVVLDPACGTGEILDVALDRGAHRAVGQELDRGLAHLAELRLRIGGAGGRADTRTGDSLRDDKFPSLNADAVLCHPPFGDWDWGHEELAHDARWQYGIPPKAEPELAWVQHALAHLRPGGRAVMLLPPAVASRPSARRIRAELLRRGTLRAVISMPLGAVRPRHVGVHLWVLATPVGLASTDPRVLLVQESARPGEASEASGTGSRSRQASWDGFAGTVAAAWHVFTSGSQADDDQPGRWKVVRAIDLLDETVDVSPARHVGPAAHAASPAQTRDEVRALTGQLRAALTGLADGLPEDDWPAGDQGTAWPAVTVAELARRGLVEFHRGSGHPGETRLREGDVLVPVAASGPLRGRVVTTKDAGTILGRHLHLIRPDSATLDPWFLAGCLAAPASVQQASYGTAASRIDARRLAVPLLPLAAQRRYGVIFRRLRATDAAVAHVSGLAGELTDLLARSLADGTLLPPAHAGSDEGATK